MDFGCAAYCKFAEQCLGTLPEEFVGSQDNLLKDKVAIEMKRFYKTDFKKISKVSRIAHYAEKIGKEEEANMGIILCAAYLNDIAQKHVVESSEIVPIETVKKESISIATDILSKLGAKAEVLDEVCRLIQIHNTKEAENVPESMILSDAQQAARLEEEQKHQPLEPNTVLACLEQEFLTASGKKITRTTFQNLGVLGS